MKIITIFGAGASHDSKSRHVTSGRPELKPPLTDELFNEEYTASFIHRYPNAAGLIPDVRRGIGDGKTIETILTELWDRRSQNRYLGPAITELQRYLAHFFKEVSQHYLQHGSNYRQYISLLQELNFESLFVSFNYDTLLDQELSQMENFPFTKPADYINCKIPLIKVHGSWNWIQEQDGGITVWPHNVKLSTDTINNPMAIGLPIPSQKGFVCPQNHLDALKSALQETVCIVVIGWKAREPHFFELLEQAGSKSKTIHLLVVARSEDTQHEVTVEFSKYFKSIRRPSNIGLGGFDAFLEAASASRTAGIFLG